MRDGFAVPTTQALTGDAGRRPGGGSPPSR
jgi:hypothetical protein